MQMAMETSDLLLETPKKVSLQTRADDLRASLKDWERSFATGHDGKKPGKVDIKSNAAIAATYKEYNKVRSLLDGDLVGGTLSPTRSPTTKRRQLYATHSVNADRQERLTDRTPQKSRIHPNHVDPYNVPASASPRPMFSKAIGPTPQRDGQVMGLFDMIYNSGSRKSSQSTPSTNKKRKIDSGDRDTIGKDVNGHLAITQTPSQRPSKRPGDFFAEATSPEVARLTASGGRRHSRTPASEGRKFMLEQIFATPNALRYASLIQGDDESQRDVKISAVTPLRDSVLGKSALIESRQTAPDDTPTYLKRSFSFTQRLLSATKQPSSTDSAQTSFRDVVNTFSRGSRPRPFRSAKFIPKPPSQVVARLQQDKDDSDDDDDLDALREVEASEANRMDNQQGALDEGATVSNEISHEGPSRTWKKKGQKRTTRRVMMRPVKMKPTEAPKYVAMDDDNETADVGGPSTPADSDYGTVSEDELAGLDIENALPIKATQSSSYATSKRHTLPVSKQKKMAQSSSKPEDADFISQGPSKSKSKVSQKDEGDGKRKTEKSVRKYNPNATSHMNFRTLKIRNKNSKGKGRFGGGRRR